MNLDIKKFGPINHTSFALNEISFLIGEQASGKSTILKSLYFFLQMRDEVKDYIFATLEKYDAATQNSIGSKIKADLSIRARNLFLSFFGPMVQDKEMHLSFQYTNEFAIEIKPNIPDTKRLEFLFPDKLIGLIVEIIKQNADRFQQSYSKMKLFSSVKSSVVDIEIEKIQKDIHARVNDEFGFSYEILFIPAGRSILSTLCDQLQGVDPKLLDYPMRKFIANISSTKHYFRKDLSEIIEEKRQVSEFEYPEGQFNELINKIRNISMGKFLDDDSGGRFIVKNNKYVKINFSSSGQQESLWILLPLFILALENVNAMVMIEEPEAHLFPNGQKNILEFIAHVRGISGARFFIATHSPYILSAANNLIYAANLASNNHVKANQIIHPELQLSAQHVSAYKISRGKMSSIFNQEIQQIDAKEIDLCSAEINDVYAKLEDVEFEK